MPTLSVPLNGLMINWNEVVVTYNGTKNGLGKDQEYFVLLDEGAFKDYSGNACAGITSNSIWQFKTGKDYMTGTSDIEGDNIIIYPNPTSGLIQITGLPISKETLLSVYNVLGQLVTTKKVNSGLGEIDISNQKPGIYLLVVANYKLQTFKIIKE